MGARKRPRVKEIELTIDESALQACDAVGFRAQQWPCHLPALVRLKDDCEALHATHPEENFYLQWPRAKALLAARRRPALLGYVAEVLDFYLDEVEGEGMPIERRRCGAEFWVQRRAAGQGITFHWVRRPRTAEPTAVAPLRAARTAQQPARRDATLALNSTRRPSAGQGRGAA